MFLNKLKELFNFVFTPKVKYELHSGFNTIASAVIVEGGVQVATHHEVWDPTMFSKGLFLAIGLALVRAAWKAGLQYALSLWGIKTPVEPK